MKIALSIFSIGVALAASITNAADKIRVVVWDEQQPRQKEAYADFLGNAIAGYLKKNAGFEVTTRKLDDKTQGIGDETLEDCDVLIWWGHVRQHEITTESAKKVVARIKDGKLALIALHSAHWSAPFMEAMNERTRMEAQKRYGSNENVKFEFVEPPGRFAPSSDSLVTPAYYALKKGRGVGLVRVDLPNCCFPDYRPDGKPSVMTVLKPDHPIAKGLPLKFTIPHTEMYNEPFHVPEPDEVVFREDWEQGEWFRSGSVWNIGKGKVFYFRPGHETYGVYLEHEPLQVIENAVRWLGPLQK